MERLPAPPLTVRPSGLLDFLSIQAGGRYPQHLTEDLVPVFDIGDWFADANAENQTSVALTQSSAASATVGFTVPAGEAWRVRSYSVYGLVPAGMTNFANALCTFDADATTVRHILASSPRTYVAAEQMAWNWTPSIPDVWMPGTPIGLVCIAAIGSPAFQPTMRLRVVRCTV